MTPTQERQTGSSAVQGELWGERARDFATQEPKSIALYEAVLDELRIGPGTRLLDVGCGAGLFLKLAEQRGAVIAGLDAAASLIEIARERSPAADLVVGEMEQLPFAARSFDVVTGFNAYEFAANPDRALAEAARVGIPAAAVVIATWGQREQCEAAAYVTELGALLAPRQGAQRPFAVSETNAMEWFATRAGLTVGPHREVLCVWHYPDTAALLRAFASTGFAVQAIKTVGEEAVTRAILNAVAPFRLSDGGYRLENVFEYMIAAPASAAMRDDPQRDTTYTNRSERTPHASAGQDT